MGKMKAAAEVGDAVEPALVVFGLDDSKKAHAAWFSHADADLADRAAGLMRMKALPVTTPEHRVIALELPAGRIFESGRGFVPFCKMAVFERLTAFPETYKPPMPIVEEVALLEPMPAITGVPSRWEDISAGSLVLAPEEDVSGWFESVVVELKPEALFVLRWRDWPDLPSFVRRGDNLALLPPVNESIPGPTA